MISNIVHLDFYTNVTFSLTLWLNKLSENYFCFQFASVIIVTTIVRDREKQKEGLDRKGLDEVHYRTTNTITFSLVKCYYSYG